MHGRKTLAIVIALLLSASSCLLSGEDSNSSLWDGTWIGGCQIRTVGGSEQDVWVISGTQFSTVTNFYDDTSDCTGAVTPRHQSVGTFEVGSAVPGVSNTWEVNVTTTSPAHTLYTISRVQDGKLTPAKTTAGHDGTSPDMRRNTLEDDSSWFVMTKVQ